MSEAPTLDPRLRARVLAAVDTPSPTRAVALRRDAAILCAFAVITLAVFFGFGGMREWGAPRSPALIAGTVLGLAGCAGFGTYVALNRGGSMLGRPAHQLWSVILVTPLLAFAWKVLWSSLYVGGLDDWPSRFGNKCMGLVVLMGTILMIGATLISRSERALPGLGGAALGVAVGAIATTLVDFWCPVGHPFHVFYGHILPIAFVALLGAAAARAAAVSHALRRGRSGS